jgi:hypothetical protein
MTPAAVDLALEIRREVEHRQDDADRLRARAVERAQLDADLAQRRYMLIDPNNRLVADTLEAEWNDKLRALATAREERERARRDDAGVLDAGTRDRFVAMTTDFRRVWADPATTNRDRKRMLASVIEDATLVKVPATGTTRIHVRFKGGKTETLETQNPKSSAQQVKTNPAIVHLVDRLLDDHIYAEIADQLNARGLQPGGSARSANTEARFTAIRVMYLVHTYGLRSRYDRLRARGLLTKQEMTQRLGIHEHTLVRWRKHGIIRAQAYNGHDAWLYEDPGPNLPITHCSRWDRLVDRAAGCEPPASHSSSTAGGVV